MLQSPNSVHPLDPGRINTTDELELRYWCAELHCSVDQLTKAVAQVGEHVAAVRAQLKSAEANR